MEEDEEELPKLIKSDEKCDEDRGKFQIQWSRVSLTGQISKTGQNTKDRSNDRS